MILSYRTILVVLAFALPVLMSGCADNLKENHEVVFYDLTPVLESNIRVDAVFDPGAPGCRNLIGEGWHPPVNKTGSIAHAWTRNTRATFGLPIARPDTGRILVHGYGLADGKGPRTVNLVVNGYDLGRQNLPRRLGWLNFSVSRNMLRANENTVEIITERLVRPADIMESSDQRSLGIYVDFIQFLPATDESLPESDSPFAITAATTLDAERSLQLGLAQPGGARFHLSWTATDTTAGDQLIVSITDEAQVEPSFTASFPVVQKHTAHAWNLPQDLPTMAAVTVQLRGTEGETPKGQVILQSAHLEWEYIPTNVVLIVVDTLRPDYLGCYGDPRERSPHIDSLASDGILFENAISHTPITGPSHAALFTSRYPSETGVLNNGTQSLSPRQPLLAETLQERGYHTGAAISLPPLTHRLGFDRGFTSYSDSFGIDLMITAESLTSRSLAILANLQPPFLWWAHFCDPHAPYNAHGLVQRTADLYLNGELLATVTLSAFEVQAFDLNLGSGPATLRLQSRDRFRLRRFQVRGEDGRDPTLTPRDLPSTPVTSHTVEIGADGSRQVRLILGLSDEIPDQVELHERYSREVAFVDKHVGALLDSLKARDWYEESLIIFTSDHGEALGEKDYVGHIHTLYDSMLKVPLIIKPPRSLGTAAGQRRGDLAGLVDITPTILACLDIDLPPLGRGRDLLARKAANSDAQLYCETHAPQAFHTLYGLRGSDYKIIFTPDQNRYELYDLVQDPQETLDMNTDDERLAREWQQMLEKFQEELAARAEGEADVEVDEETQRQLRALGY